MKNHNPNPVYRSRREMLLQSGAGFGALALASLIDGSFGSTAAASDKPVSPLTAKLAHHTARAKIFVHGRWSKSPGHV